MSKTYSLYDASGHNNGNILSITDTLSANHTQQYAYDYLNRISKGLQNDGAFNQTFSVDPWGNLGQSGTWAFTPSFDANNRIAGSTVGSCTYSTQTYCYDWLEI